MNTNIQAVAMGHLSASHGWKIDRILTNVATKDHDTAVGPKQASVRIKFDAECSQYWLNAEYYSEGRNALAGCIACFPATADDATVEAHVDAFVASATKMIGGTYAARLLTNGGAA